MPHERKKSLQAGIAGGFRVSRHSHLDVCKCLVKKQQLLVSMGSIKLMRIKLCLRRQFCCIHKLITHLIHGAACHLPEQHSRQDKAMQKAQEVISFQKQGASPSLATQIALNVFGLSVQVASRSDFVFDHAQTSRIDTIHRPVLNSPSLCNQA